MRIVCKIEDHGQEIRTALASELRDVAKSSARRVVFAASRKIRNVSGELAASGKVTDWQKKHASGAYVSFGSNKIYYAPFVELGTPGTRLWKPV